MEHGDRVPSIRYLGHFHIQQKLISSRVQRAARSLVIVGEVNKVFKGDIFVDVIADDYSNRRYHVIELLIQQAAIHYSFRVSTLEIQ